MNPQIVVNEGNSVVSPQVGLRFDGSLKTDVPLSGFTTWRVGGPARYLLLPRTVDDLRKGLELTRRRDIPFYILGNGSNVLARDEGFSGLVIALKGSLDDLWFGKRTVFAGAGLSLSKLACQARTRGINEFDFLYGIPGTVGGAVLMNAGSSGAEISQLVNRVYFLSSAGTIEKLSRSECRFGYRDSLFNHLNHIIIGVEFKIGSRDLQLDLTTMSNKRKDKFPVHHPSAGCVFRNPGDGLPSAGEMIDRAGCKGMRVGSASVSQKHANFIINEGKARSSEILELIHRIRQRVYRKFNILLELEIEIISG